MKLNLLKLLSLSLLVFAGLTFTSCDPDPCKDVVCGDNGLCLDGFCDCNPGYSGESCEILLRTAYVGMYDAAEICTSDASYTDNYTAEVKTSSDGFEYIIITNLYNHFNASSPGTYQPEDTQVKAIVSDSGLEIPETSFTATGIEAFSVVGTGSSISGTGFTINFTLTNTALSPGDQGYQDECSVTYVAQ